MGYDYDDAEADYWSGNYDSGDYAYDAFVGGIPRGGIQFPTAQQAQTTRDASPGTGEKMKTNTQLATEAEQLRAEAERLEQILAAREKYGDDPFKNGTVLKVDMKYRGTTRSYAYAAIKTAGKFWLSGKLARTGAADATDAQPTGMTWEQFVGWLSQGDATVWQAGGLRQVL